MTETTRFPSVVIKTAIVHTVTYFFVGWAAQSVFDYGSLYTDSALRILMRPLSHPLVMAGVLFQPARGFLFGLVFHLLRTEFFDKPRGWLTMWLVLLIVGIISPFGPSPGSIEGLVYTVLPPASHTVGQVEVWLQSFLLAYLTHHWVNRPDRRWYSVLAGILFAVCMILPAMGLAFRSAV